MDARVTRTPEDTGLVGREEQRRRVEDFLSEQESAALLIEGEAGIGKTTLWRHGLSVAREQGARVLVASLVGRENELAYAGLADLLAEVIDDVAGLLPPPQRRALDVALLRQDAVGRPPDRRAIATAFLNALRTVAAASRLVVAVDDVQWLDEASAAVLRFAVGRLGDTDVRLLLARRGIAHDAPFDVDRARPLVRVELGPLSIGALHRLLNMRLGVAFSRPVLARIQTNSNGNPLYALELARALHPNTPLAPDGEVPVPPTLEELVHERISELPAETRRLLLAAALARDEGVGRLAEVADVPDAEAAVRPAIEHGLVTLHGDSIAFRHPLYRGALAGAASELRTRLHLRLATVATRREERARHLAAATTEPDDAVAAELADVAREVRDRGAPGAAGELLARAADLTPASDVPTRRARLLEAARELFEGGEAQAARRCAAEALAVSSHGRDRAEASLELARVSHEDLTAAIRLREAALKEAGGDSDLVLEAATRLSAAHVMSGDITNGRRYADLAADIEPDASDDEVRARALAQIGIVQMITAGRPEQGVLERSVELEQRSDRSAGYMGRVWLAVDRTARGDFDAARGILERLLPDDETDANLTRAIDALDYLTRLEVYAGRLDVARAHAERALALSEQFGVDRLRAKVLADLALAAGAQGDLDVARAAAREGLHLAEQRRHVLYASRNREALGAVEVAAGRVAAAAEALRPLAEDVAAMGDAEPMLLPYEGNLIDALIATGDLPAAFPVVDSLERRGEAACSPWAIAVAARGRALLQAVEGNSEQALDSFADALSKHASWPGSIERGRTLLAYGATLRRLRKRGGARDALDEAAAIFDEVGARLWAERAREELSRVSGRGRSDGSLTSTEQRIAELVASGRSNKEVAAALYITVHTVETHLSKVYAKLGIRSRTELAQRLTAS